MLCFLSVPILIARTCLCGVLKRLRIKTSSQYVEYLNHGFLILALSTFWSDNSLCVGLSRASSDSQQHSWPLPTRCQQHLPQTSPDNEKCLHILPRVPRGMREGIALDYNYPFFPDTLGWTGITFKAVHSPHRDYQKYITQGGGSTEIYVCLCCSLLGDCEMQLICHCQSCLSAWHTVGAQ